MSNNMTVGKKLQLYSLITLPIAVALAIYMPISPFGPRGTMLDSVVGYLLVVMAGQFIYGFILLVKVFREPGINVDDEVSINRMAFELCGELGLDPELNRNNDPYGVTNFEHSKKQVLEYLRQDEGALSGKVK